MIATRPEDQGGEPVAAVPEDSLERCWALLAAGEADQAATVAEQLEARLRADPTASGTDRAALLAVRARSHLLRGDLDAAVVLHTLARRQRRPFPDDVRDIADLVDLVAQLGWFRGAADLVAQHGGPTTGPLVEAAAGAALVEGRLGAALDLARAALAAADVSRPGRLVTERIGWVVGAALLEQGHATAAVAPLRTACALARRDGLQHVLTRAGTALARAHALLGEPDEGYAVLDEARRPLHAGGLPDRIRAWIDQAEARLLLEEGDVEDAATVVGRLGGDRPGPEVVVLQAWAALARSDPEAAARLLDRTWSDETALGALIEADILRSRCAIGRQGVLHPLAAAVHRAEPEGYVAVFLEHGAALVEPLRALQGVEARAHVTLLLQRLRRLG